MPSPERMSLTIYGLHPSRTTSAAFKELILSFRVILRSRSYLERVSSMRLALFSERTHAMNFVGRVDGLTEKFFGDFEVNS